MGDFLTSLPAIAKAIADMFVSIFESISTIFYVPAQGDTAGYLTFIGYLSLIVLFIGLCLMLVNWVRSLVRGGGRR